MYQIEYHHEYAPDTCVVFCKTREEWGGLSNMAAGFPLRVNGEDVRTSEALYQACRFPDRPDVQRKIIAERSPMAAKMRSKPYRQEHCRPDWDDVRVDVMRWCLRVKLAQNYYKFKQLLLETGDRDIVEYSRKDTFWGAKIEQDGCLRGANMLGYLLMELRKQVNSYGDRASFTVDPPKIENFLLFDKPIAAIKREPGFNAGIQSPDGLAEGHPDCKLNTDHTPMKHDPHTDGLMEEPLFRVA